LSKLAPAPNPAAPADPDTVFMLVSHFRLLEIINYRNSRRRQPSGPVCRAVGRCLGNLVSNSISGHLHLSYLNTAYFPTAACIAQVSVYGCVRVCWRCDCDCDCIGVVMETTRTRRTGSELV